MSSKAEQAFGRPILIHSRALTTAHHPLAPAAMGVYTILAAIGGGSRSMIPLLRFVDYVINLYEYVIIAAVIVSWLIAFNVINAHNPFVRTVWQALGAVTEPLLRPIRRYMPDLGGLDISPVVLLLACFFVRFVVINGWFMGALRG